MNQQIVRLPTKFSLSVLLAAAVLATQTGCPPLPIAGKEFRDQALPAIETGVGSILDGLVAGVFAAIQTDPNTSDQDGQGANP